MSCVNKAKGERELTYRLATDDDLELCMRFRAECGWGAEKLAAKWGDPIKPICVFSQGDLDVGMGGWLLELPDPEDASRQMGIVQLTALFICKQHQGGGLGGRALDLLEKAAVDVYGAGTVTLDTVAFENTWDNGAGDWASEAYVENPSKPSMAKQWYMRRGYEVYKPNAPHFLIPSQPGTLKTACFLRKRVR